MKSTRIQLPVLALCLLVMTILFGTGNSLAAETNPVVIMETSMGRIIVQLYPDKAPVTVQNFLRYVDEGFYNGTIFHRVIRQGSIDNPGRGMNVVQGGGLDSLMLEKRPLWGPIPNEDASGLENVRGTIAMARMASPDSATTQFFFNVQDNAMLNPVLTANSMGTMTVQRHGYCVFGRVLRGLDVLEQILKVKTGRRGRYDDVPLKPVLLTKAYRAR